MSGIAVAIGAATWLSNLTTNLGLGQSTGILQNPSSFWKGHTDKLNGVLVGITTPCILCILLIFKFDTNLLYLPTPTLRIHRDRAFSEAYTWPFPLG